MDYYSKVIAEIAGVFKIVPLTPFRHTPGVFFDLVPAGLVGRISAIDRVVHEHGAVSPGPVGDVDRPWYMHPNQDDNLIVMAGSRHVDLYRKQHGRIESFVVTPREIRRNGELLFEGSAMLVWPRGVFHRIVSGEHGSASLNFAVHYPGFDLGTNFSIYRLDPASGDFAVIREGYRDQYDYTEVSAPTE